ncbi:ATP-binding protein [Asticcacaulis sp. EMRT-3]|uniref:ATP-binding protein n=1 Tax=Asticcacaulis sp. EMRT-3 TaxID=3040349 RepID=UPI0024AEDF90|nr:ATP-binding protein [Asticcacaulis sp. EMRT-3]MDI7774736.1 ATP-binding protein [Asticcacaulis sp. EMRT-3]
MRHRHRTLSKTLETVSSVFPVVLITGPRQVGKTTLLQDCAEATRGYVSLDDLDQRALAKTDPALFLQLHKAPLIIDEVQYAPQLFSVIKGLVDKDQTSGQYWLTGSQKFHLMHGISETLAGRIAILDLIGLSQTERDDRAVAQSPFLPTLDWIEKARPQPSSSAVLDVYHTIWTGSFPAIALNPDMPRDIFYSSYIQTYIQRDVRDLTRVGDEVAFARFLRAAAARTGQLINYADMARDVDVDQKTIKAWLSILETSGLVFMLQPYHNNITNRLVKTPKLYFLDTGLCAYLTQWSTPEALEAGAMSGAILETYMLAEILKSYWNRGKVGNFYFYRDRDQREVDLLISQDGKLYPIEFKKTMTPSLGATKNFAALEALKQPIGDGCVICLKEIDIPLSKAVWAIPVGYL